MKNTLFDKDIRDRCPRKTRYFHHLYKQRISFLEGVGILE